MYATPVMIQTCRAGYHELEPGALLIPRYDPYVPIIH